MKRHIAKKLKKSKVNDIKLSILFKDFGQLLFTVYEPIIFYQFLGKRIEFVMIYYGLQSIMYALLARDGAKVMAKIGIKKNMIFATFILIAYNLILLMFADRDLSILTSPGETTIWFAILAILCSIYQALYWPAFHTDLSLYMENKNSGKDIGAFYFIDLVSSIIAPVLGGIVLLKAGTSILIYISVFFIFISIFPLFKGPDSKPKVSFTFKEFLGQIFHKQNIKSYLPFFAEGTNAYISSIFWPLFVFSIISSVLDLGLLVSGVSLFTAITVLILGHLLDKNDDAKDKVLKLGVTTSSLGWLIKGLQTSPITFFIADNIQQFGDSVVSIPFEKTMYKRFKDIKSLADEYVVIREMIYHFSGAFIMFLLAFLIWRFNIIYSAFIIASISYLFYLLMK